MTRPTTVSIREVGPATGFQNEPESIPTADKIRLINALGRAGFKRIEVASFVRPDVIPQLADGVEVLRGIDVPDDVRLMVLVPNSKGLDNALAHRDLFHDVVIFVSGSETHNAKNVRRTIAETMADNAVMMERIKDAGLYASAVIATSFGCPFEGKVPMDRVSTSPNSSPPWGSMRSASVTRPACAIRRMPVPSSPRPSVAFPLWRSPLTSTTPGDRAWPMRMPPWRPGAPAFESSFPSVSWWLSGAGRFDRQHRHRGSGQHVPRDGRRHRGRPGQGHRGSARAAQSVRAHADQSLPRRRPDHLGRLTRRRDR